MKNTELKEQYSEKIIQEFRIVLDFYRMEYADDPVALFHEFGCLLIQESGEKNGAYTDFAPLASYEYRITKNSVRKPLLQVVDDVKELWQELDADAVFEVVYAIHELCMKNSPQKGRFVLPGEVTGQLVRIIQAERNRDGLDPIASVFDPQYGSGEMLLRAYQDLKPKGNGENEIAVYGIENDERLRLSGQILTYLAGVKIKTPKGEFLREPLRESFDLVLANPPFGNDNVAFDTSAVSAMTGMRRIRGRYHLALAGSLLTLKENGSAAVVVPDSFLFLTRKESVELRKWMMNTFQIEMILSLPEKTFYPSSVVRTSVVILNKPFLRSWQGYTEYVLFYRMEGEPGSTQNEKEYEKLLKIKDDMYRYMDRRPKDPSDANFWFADYRAIEENEWSLLPEHYRPMERRELTFEAPEQLLKELIGDQKKLLDQMYRLLEEVEDL